MRTKLIASSDVPGEREALEAWLEKWAGTLSFVSEEMGCGCCVFIREVEAPKHALAKLPIAMRADS